MPQAVAFRAVYATRPEDTMDLDNAAAPTPHSSAPLSTPHPSAVETCPLNHANPPLPYHIDTLLGGLVNIPAVIAADDTKLIPPIDGGPKYAGVYFDTKRIGWKVRSRSQLTCARIPGCVHGDICVEVRTGVTTGAAPSDPPCISAE